MFVCIYIVTSINEVVNDAARKCFATKNCKKRIKIIIEIVDVKDGLIRTVRRQKKELLLSTKKSSKISKRSYC